MLALIKSTIKCDQNGRAMNRMNCASVTIVQRDPFSIIFLVSYSTCSFRTGFIIMIIIPALSGGKVPFRLFR